MSGRGRGIPIEVMSRSITRCASLRWPGTHESCQEATTRSDSTHIRNASSDTPNRTLCGIEFAGRGLVDPRGLDATFIKAGWGPNERCKRCHKISQKFQPTVLDRT